MYHGLFFFYQIRWSGEGSIDHGGPRREFFRVLGNALKETYFRGKDEKKFFEQNVTAVQVHFECLNGI